jgi:hypothetical protein
MEHICDGLRSLPRTDTQGEALVRGRVTRACGKIVYDDVAISIEILRSPSSIFSDFLGCGMSRARDGDRVQGRVAGGAEPSRDFVKTSRKKCSGVGGRGKECKGSEMPKTRC